MPAIIRLGDHNLEAGDDGAEPVEYEIKRVIKHENYDKNFRDNDIALIELKTDVNFTMFIRPACLQLNNRFNRTVVAVRR